MQINFIYSSDACTYHHQQQQAFLVQRRTKTFPKFFRDDSDYAILCSVLPTNLISDPIFSYCVLPTGYQSSNRLLHLLSFLSFKYPTNQYQLIISILSLIPIRVNLFLFFRVIIKVTLTIDLCIYF